MPRALTEQEKCKQCQKLLEKGNEIIFSQGMRKISVDDIAKAADMAKGSFYQHFDSKEAYLAALIMHNHRQAFVKATQVLQQSGNLRANAENLLAQLFQMPEMVFFIRNHREIDALFDAWPGEEQKSFVQMEAELFEGLLKLAEVDTQVVKPGVVHNFVHTLYLIAGSDLMTRDDCPETIHLITDCLIRYIFADTRRTGGAS